MANPNDKAHVNNPNEKTTPFIELHRGSGFLLEVDQSDPNEIRIRVDYRSHGMRRLRVIGIARAVSSSNV